MVALQPGGRLAGAGEARRVARQAGAAGRANVQHQPARPRRHALLAGLRRREIEPVAEAEAVADMALQRRRGHAVGRRHHHVGEGAVEGMRPERRLPVGRPGRDAGAEHRLGEGNDPALAIEQQPRHRPELAVVIALADDGDPALRIGRRARHRLDRDLLDDHRVEIEIVEFEPRRRGDVPAGEQPFAGVEAHPGRNRDSRRAPFRRGPASHLDVVRPDPRLDSRPGRAHLAVLDDRHRPSGRILPGDGPLDDPPGGIAKLLEAHFAAVDDLAAVRARHDLARGKTEHVAVVGDDRVPDRCRWRRPGGLGGRRQRQQDLTGAHRHPPSLAGKA